MRQRLSRPLLRGGRLGAQARDHRHGEHRELYHLGGFSPDGAFLVVTHGAKLIDRLLVFRLNTRQVIARLVVDHPKFTFHADNAALAVVDQEKRNLLSLKTNRVLASVENETSINQRQLASPIRR